MASIIAGAAHTAHSTAASLLSSAQIHPGKPLPPLKVKETSPERAEIVQLSGTTVIVRALPCIVHALNFMTGRRPGSIHWNVRRPDPRVHRQLRGVQGQGRDWDIRRCRQ